MNTCLAASQWHASLSLCFAQTARGCRLTHCAHQGPLYVQKAFYPEGRDLAHAYILHPPGGLVSGDQLAIDIRLEKNARVLLTTPGAGRVYRARHDRSLQQQRTTMVLEESAVMEWLPQETIVYPSSHASLDTHIVMAPGSCFIGWEICCLGLPASDLHFTDGEIRQSFRLFAGKKPVLIDRFEINGLNRNLYQSSVGLRGQPVTALMIAGPFDADSDAQILLIEKMREEIEKFQSAALCAVSVINGFFVARYLGNNADEAKRIFISLWGILRPALTGREACAPRIWST